MCDDFRQQLFSNGFVQCAVSSFTCAVSFDSYRHRLQCFARETSAHIFTPQNSVIRPPRFARKISTWNPLSHAQGTYRQNCMIELPRNHISELHFDKFRDSSGFQCWKPKFETKVSSCSGYLPHAMLWIKEVEVAESVDHLMMSQSIGGYVLTKFEMLDAKIASTLKRIISNQFIRRRITSSSTRQISSRKTDRLHDLRTFPSYWRS